MTCRQCNQHPYDVNFVNGICLACQSINELARMESVWNAELLIYTQRSGFVYDICDFYYYAMAGEVDVKHLAGLPELYKAYTEAVAEARIAVSQQKPVPVPKAIQTNLF